MSSLGSPSPFFLAGKKKAYEVERSLRFNDGDSAYLNRTPSSTSNRKTFTISWWFKLGTLGTIRAFFGAYDNSTSGNDSYYFSCIISNQGINLGAWTKNWLVTNRLFRDPNAWYHCVLAYDTTQSTADNRVRMYINGVEETSFAQRNNPSQNFDLGWNFSSQMQTIGRVNYLVGSGPYPFDGYMAEFNSIDGLQLTPSSFGETDAVTGQWIPKKYTGSYGTNGFYLNFSDNSGTTATTLGKDSSGNGNNFTPNNFSVAAGAGNDSLEDTPTNNFPTLNPLNINPYSSSGYPSPTFSNGNLTFSTNQNNAVNYAESSFYFPSTGKWYLEVAINNINIGSGLGYLQALTIRSATSGSYYLWWVYSSPYYQINTDSGLVTISAPSNGQVLQLAFDADTGKTWFGNNNTWYLSGDPANGTAMSSPITVIGDDVRFSVSGRSGSAANIVDVNFGQRAFSYTPPTGFQALCSANLPDPTIKLPNKHFDTLLYTGNGSSNHTITGLNFQPDWVWLKSRSAAHNHGLMDAVRGRAEVLFSNSTSDEKTSGASQDLVSFNSNGITVGTPYHLSASNNNGTTIVGWNWNAGDTDGKTYTVKVVSDSGNKYRFDNFGTSAVTLDLAEGGSYVFDLSHSSVDGHPMKFSTTANGSHGGGSTYSTGVTYILDGVEKSEADYVNTTNFNAATSRLLKITVAASAPTLYYFCHYHNLMGGQANTNSTLGSSNFDGTIQSTVKANTTAGFSIVTYTGNGSSGATIGHGLGIAPDALILKRRDGSNSWQVFHQVLGSGKFMDISSSYQAETSSNRWNNTSPTSTVFTVGNNSNVNSNGGTEVAFCFSEVAGYSKFGSYEANNSSDGPFVYLGFEPKWIMMKPIDNSGNWQIYDNKRTLINKDDGNALYADLSSAETSGFSMFDFLSNGFKLRNTGAGGINYTNTYIYLAFAESPFKNARAR